MIPQLDGGYDEDEILESQVKKIIYSVNIESYDISIVVNFLRSCTFFWKCTKHHPLCEFYPKHKEMSCFFVTQEVLY